MANATMRTASGTRMTAATILRSNDVPPDGEAGVNPRPSD
jgi:hypothetical protein